MQGIRWEAAFDVDGIVNELEYDKIVYQEIV